MEALQSATRNPAEFLGRLDSLGTVEPEKMADLILLDANPLQDISNVASIAAVIFRGRVFDQRKLDAMRAQMKEAARSER